MDWDIKIKIDKIYSIVLVVFLCAIYISNEYRPYFEILFYAVFVTYFIRKRKRLTGFAIWSLALVGFSAFSLLWSYDVQKTILETRILLQWAIMSNLIIAYADSENKIRNFYKYLVIAGISLIVILVYTFPLTTWLDGRLGSNAILGLNPNRIGLNLTVSAIAALHMYKASKRKSYLAVLIIFIVTIVLTGSRKALFILIFGMIGLVYLNSRNITKKINIIMIGLLVSVLVYFAITTIQPLYEIVGYRIEAVFDSLLGRGDSDESLYIRKTLIDSGRNLFLRSPLVGYGMGSFGTVSGYDTYAHNNYIEMLVGLGVFGTLIYYSMYMFVIKNLFKMKKYSKDNLLLIIMISLIIMEYALVSYRSPIYHVVIALSYATIRIYKLKKRNLKIKEDNKDENC